MKSVGMKMSLMMGTALSFCLSLVGNLSSGHFTVPGFLISFAVSLVISLIIGFLVPMGKVTMSLDRKLNMAPDKLSTRCFNALISDLIYTPLITFVMVTMAWKQATSHGAPIPYWPMLLKSLVLTMIVGYVLIFILTPVFMKIAMKGARK